MSELSAYTCTPRQATAFITDCIESGLVPFLEGSPGVGKSSIMRAISTKYNLEMIDHRLSTSAPEDLSGLPRFTDEGIATFAPFDIFPIESTPLPKDKDGWNIFFDEMNSANKSVQAATYKIILDKMIGQHRLHSNVVITAAGNKATDRAIVNSLSTAMQSRLVHLTLEVSFQEWLEDVALPQNYDSRIIAFLNWKNDHLMDFSPDHQDKTFCCPRTWEFMNRLIKGKEVSDSKIALYAGTITSGVALKFLQFTKVFESLPTLKAIINEPEEVGIPVEASTRWAVITNLMEKADDTNLKELTTYINRFPSEFRILFFRGLRVRQPELAKHPAFVRALLELSKYLYD